MIKNLIISIVCVVFFGTAFDMIFPNGNLKKYFKLVMGFVLIRVIILPFAGNHENFEFDFLFDEKYTQEELIDISDAYILKIHEENITKYIQQICGEDAEIFVELFTDGNIRSVVIKGSVSSEKIESLKKELGCENIRTTEVEDEF